MPSMALMLAARKLKVEARNAQDESPLMMAAIKGNVEAVRADRSRRRCQQDGLDAAALRRVWWHHEQHLRMLALLLENHAYIDAASPNGTTPLMMAAQYGSAEMVKLLLDEGADPTLKNQLGLTACEFCAAGQPQRIGCAAFGSDSQAPAQRGSW
jgi:ankyrin repeat protein